MHLSECSTCYGDAPRLMVSNGWSSGYGDFGFSWSDLDPFNKNSAVREGLRQLDPTSNTSAAGSLVNKVLGVQPAASAAPQMVIAPPAEDDTKTYLLVGGGAAALLVLMMVMMKKRQQ